jgi:hypothetical protein
MKKKDWNKLKPGRKKEILDFQEMMKKIPKLPVDPKKRPKSYMKSKSAFKPGKDLGKEIKGYWDRFPK